MIKRLLMGGILAATLSISCWASTIPVYGTGVNNIGGLLPASSADSHWTITSSPLGPATAYVYDGGYPIPPWALNGPDSMWISPTSDTGGPSGTYVYQTTFDLTGLDASTAQLSGSWSTDDSAEAYLNGNDIGTLNWANLSAFSVTNSAYFVAGINTLTINVNNLGGPTGLRVNISGTADLLATDTPEPATMLFAAAGLGALALVKRRRASR